MAKSERIRLPRERWYVGVRILVDGRGMEYEAFKSRTEPTEADYGHLYMYSIGPFHSHEAAAVMAKYGRGNPHMQCVADVESVLKHWKEVGYDYLPLSGKVGR